MAGIVSKDIYRLVKTTTTEIDIMDRIYHGDVDAYNIDIEFYGVTSISGTCNLHFVLPDGTALDKDASDGVVIDGNNVKYTLPTYLYQQSGNLTMYVQFMNSNIYTPLKVNFKNIVAIPDGGEEVVATTTYPVWYDDAKEAETARATWEEFNALTVYSVGEKVYYPTTGSSYILHTASGVANTLPTDTDYWQKITDKGDTGSTGAQGIQGIQGEDGNGIVSIVRTSGTGAAGTTDTYTITYDDATTSTFQVYNGADGEGSGDMIKAIYDPNTVNGDAFDTDNHVSGTTNKVFTATEQTKLSGMDEGTRTYTEQNYVTNSETVTASIDKLDQNLKDVDDETATNTTNIGNRTYTENNYVTDSESVTDSIDALDMAIASAGGGFNTYEYGNEITLTWAQIQTKCLAGDFSGIQIGDWKSIVVGAETVIMEVAGIDTYYGYASNDKHNIDFISRDCLSTAYKYNTTDTSIGGWPVSALYTTMNGTGGIYDSLPSDVKAVIGPKLMYLENKASSNSTTWAWHTENKLWLLAELEVFGYQSASQVGYGSGNFKQYPLFAGSEKHIIKGAGNGGSATTWWELSPGRNSVELFCYVGDRGFAHNYYASTAYHIPLCFRVS